MDLPIGIQKDEFWQRHIEEMKKFKGTQAEYAKANGFTLPQLLYYRDKFRKKSGFAKVMAVKTKPDLPKPTPASERRAEPKPVQKTAVENFDTYPQRLPDAKWLAELIRELTR